MTDLATIQQLSAAGRHQECLQVCQNALQANPEETYAYKYAGKSLLALGQLEKAQQCLVKAHQLDGSDPEIVKDIGNIFNAIHNYQDASKYYNLSLKINPNYAPAFNNLGLIAKQQGNLQVAKQLVERARDLDPRSVPFHLNLSFIYKELGQLDQALAATLKSLELKADNPDAHINLGGIYKQLGQLDQALAATLKSLELKADNPTAHMNLGGIYKELGQLDQALASTLKSLALKPDNADALMNLGSIYQELGQLDQALAATLKSLELKPDNPTAHMNLGGIYKELGQLDQALASTLKSLALKPDNADALMNLGSIYQELGQLDQALAATLKSLALKPDNADALMNLGSIYQELGQLDQALAATLKSLELKADNPTAHMNLGGIYKELGQLDQALASTLKSLELKPDNADALMNLGSIYQSMGDMEESAESLQKALAMNPHLPAALYVSSQLLEDVNSAYSLLEKIKEVDQTALPIRDKSKIEFAKSNCFHKEKNYKNASIFLKEANQLKLLFMPSNASVLIKNIQAIAHTLTDNKVMPTRKQQCDQIFIVGVPRSGSTLLSAILNTNHLIKDLGESCRLPKALKAFLSQNISSNGQNLETFYTDGIYEAMPQGCITVDKRLYNFMYCHYVGAHMPGAKIIHATRNPLDNILSMLRSNLMAGNNFTASPEGSAMVIIEQEKLMRAFKKLFPHKIYTYSYDKLVNDPQAETKSLLAWLGLEWSESYLDFYKGKKIINTASVMQARQPVSNKSVGGWKNYSLLLEPARQLLLESNLFAEESLC